MLILLYRPTLASHHLHVIWRVNNILGFSHRSHITTALKQLHWLTIKFRIIFKVATIMHNILHNRFTTYRKDLVTFSISGPQRRQLRSTTTRSAVILQTRTQFGRRAFSVCGLDIWNSLPVNIRLIDSHPSFRLISLDL